MHSFRNILVGSDFSPGADAALDTAIEIASLSTGRITIVHVCELTSELEGPDARAEEDIIAHSKRRLDALLAQHSACGVELAGLLRIGRPAEKINNAAAEVGASLIVLGRSGSERGSELGRVTERLLRTASRPVLVVGAKELL